MDIAELREELLNRIKECNTAVEQKRAEMHANQGAILALNGMLELLKAEQQEPKIVKPPAEEAG